VYTAASCDEFEPKKDWGQQEGASSACVSTPVEEAPPPPSPPGHLVVLLRRLHHAQRHHRVFGRAEEPDARRREVLRVVDGARRFKGAPRDGYQLAHVDFRRQPHAAAWWKERRSRRGEFRGRGERGAKSLRERTPTSRTV
jgi:hypothetical protein